MKKNKGQTFRFPFDIDTRVFLILAAIFFLFSIRYVQNLWSDTYSTKSISKVITEDLHRVIDENKNNFSDRVISNIKVNRFRSPYASEILNTNAYYLVYLKDSLIFWNHSKILPNVTTKQKVTSLSYPEGHFVQLRYDYKHDTSLHGYLLIPLLLNTKTDFYTSTYFFPSLKEKSNYGYNLSQQHLPNSVPINLENKAVFYVYKENVNQIISDPFGWKLFLSALPFIFMGISIHTYFKVSFKFRSKIMTFSQVIGSAIIIRLINLFAGFPHDFKEFAPFNASFFYQDIFNCSLGDVFVNVCLIFWILVFYIMNIQGNILYPKLLKYRKIAPYFYLVVGVTIGLYLIDLLHTIITNSQVVFDTTLFSRINLLTFIGLLTFMVIFALLTFICFIISVHFQLFKHPIYTKFIGLALLYVLLSWLHGMDSSLNFLFAFMGVLLFLMDMKSMRIKFDFNSYELILWLIVMSLMSSLFLIYTIESKERDERNTIAEKLLEAYQMELITSTTLHNYLDYHKNKEYNYGIGIYKNNLLVSNNGYPEVKGYIQADSLFKNSPTFISNQLSISELWKSTITDGNRYSVLIAKSNNLYSRLLTVFAIIFFIYFIVISLYIIGNIIARSNLVKNRLFNLLNLNLRLRIHGTIILVILSSFIAVGYFTSYLLISKNVLKTKNNAIQTMAEIKNNLSPLLDTLAPRIYDPQSKEQIEKATVNIQSPLRIFDFNTGHLIFAKNLAPFKLTANRIPSKIFLDILTKRDEYIIYDEKVENQDFISIYSVYKTASLQNKLIIYLPYLDAKTTYRQESFSLLVTLINTFVLVFLISAFIALLLTKSVVQPFNYIVKQFTKINLNKTNTPLTWRYNDEIGLLVREYNKMLRQLENSTQLLAKDERESAWREMAKQVAHEIKNPLTPMKLSMQMLENAIKQKKENVPVLAERVTKTMIEQIDTLAIIATNFSTLARMPENKNTVISLTEVLKSVTGMYNDDKRIEYSFIIPEYEILVFADKSQLIRVFTNIIQNAIQALPDDGKGSITLSVKKIRNNYIRVDINDNGIGISKEKMSRLFEPYFTTKSSGTGLGLAMCKDIIEQLNGKISFESFEGVGTTFHIDLPIYDPDKSESDTISA